VRLLAEELVFGSLSPAGTVTLDLSTGHTLAGTYQGGSMPRPAAPFAGPSWRAPATSPTTRSRSPFLGRTARAQVARPGGAIVGTGAR
jgi:hypothetical protein